MGQKITKMPLCGRCGEELTYDVAFDGCDENSEAGSGSGFDWSVKLYCDKCGRIYPICRARKLEDVSRDVLSRG